MTNAKAIEVIRENCYVFNPMNLDRTTLVNTALDTARKALEAEDVLDKIRAEIYRKANSGQWSDATMYGMLKAVAIIDKYKVESEE